MMTTRQLLGITLSLAALALLTSAMPASATQGGVFGTVLDRYESIRVALAEDSLDGVSAGAQAIGSQLASLNEDLSAERSEVPASQLGTVEDLLPQLQQAAERLASATDIDSARDAFYELTKPLVRWRKAAGAGPDVLYCSMKKRSWLQPAGDEVGNPYLGQSMPSCGQVVSR